jgi:hypothetical protein
MMRYFRMLQKLDLVAFKCSWELEHLNEKDIENCKKLLMVYFERRIEQDPECKVPEVVMRISSQRKSFNYVW